MSDKIINLVPKKSNDDKPALQLVESGRCKHRSLLVDEESRTVNCGSCGALIDSFDALLMVTDASNEIFKRLNNEKNTYVKIRSDNDEMRKFLRKRNRYKCNYCGKFNEATAKRDYKKDIIGVKFDPVIGD